MLYRTTVRIDDELLAELKALAARQHRTLNSVMEEAFRRMITAAKEQEQRPRVKLVTSGQRGDPHPTWEEIQEILVQDDIERLRRDQADDAR
jgi:plasmid stability protein